MIAAWPYAVCTALFLLLAAAPVFSVADGAPTAHRASALDGLRGFLALGVFFHHAAIYPGFAQTGDWLHPIPRFYTLLGKVGVSYFFMITAYLFWSKAIAEQGRLQRLPLMLGRLFRIAPVYLLSAALALLAVAVESRFTLRVPLGELLGQLARWLSIGLVNPPDTNAVAGSGLLLAGVTWSLFYEWMFYLSLLPLALICRVPGLHRPFTAAGLLISLLVLRLHGGPTTTGNAVALFFAGATCASFRTAGARHAAAKSALALLLIGALFATAHSGLSPAGIILMAASFCLIVTGGDLFGLLTCRPARRLGNVSYPIYLLQGLALAAVYKVPGVTALTLQAGWRFWCVTFACGTLVIGAVTLVHRWVEQPGIALGRRVAKRRTRLDARAPISGRLAP